MTRPVDLDRLDALRVRHVRWRRMVAPELSSVYVPGEGSYPEVFIVGEAPGAQEEIQRRPFVGPSGRIQRELMASAELYAFNGFRGDYESNCWLTNVIKFRPPRNRKPYPHEIEAVRSLLFLEWQAVGNPRVIVPVGGTALHAVVGQALSITRVSGRELTTVDRFMRSNRKIHIWPMLHPAYGLRYKAIREVTERDWDRFGKWLNGRN